MVRPTRSTTWTGRSPPRTGATSSGSTRSSITHSRPPRSTHCRRANRAAGSAVSRLPARTTWSVPSNASGVGGTGPSARGVNPSGRDAAARTALTSSAAWPERDGGPPKGARPSVGAAGSVTRVVVGRARPVADQPRADSLPFPGGEQQGLPAAGPVVQQGLQFDAFAGGRLRGRADRQPRRKGRPGRDPHVPPVLNGRLVREQDDDAGVPPLGRRVDHRELERPPVARQRRPRPVRDRGPGVEGRRPGRGPLPGPRPRRRV